MNRDISQDRKITIYAFMHLKCVAHTNSVPDALMQARYIHQKCQKAAIYFIEHGTLAEFALV